ncbi:MAG: sialate O-acetylesterase [Bacillota bacterium]
MRSVRHSAYAIVMVLAMAASASAAGLRLAAVFSDNMVLQRGKPLRVWGEADANAPVEVVLGPQRQATAADASGYWCVSLPPMQISTEPRTLHVRSGGTEVAARSILVGDVWLCSGQSNMQMGLREAEGGEAEVRDAAKQTKIRLLSIPKRPSGKPEVRFDATWQICSPESAAGFSAVGFFFGRELAQDPAMANVPIGLIDSSFGGTAAEAWTSIEGLGAFKPADLLDSMFGIKPGHLYNGMVAPLIPYSLSGVIWYQGESNAGRPELYPRVLSALIADWRQRWQEPALPFLIVQLPPFVGRMGEHYFTWLREAQAEVVRSTPNTALAVTIDTTDGFDLHPKEKREVGRRLALLARRGVYKQDLVATGPVFKDAKVEGATMRVTFDTGGTGLASSMPGTIKGFAVAGDDGVYRFADAVIEGDSVLLRCQSVPMPKTVRYAWAGVPEASLTGKSGLPAAPFRTDRLPRSDIEVQIQPVMRNVSTAAYEVSIAGDGKVTSLGVRGKQFLSNALGVAGGTSIPVLFGSRSLSRIQAIGPDLLSCSDNEVTLLLAFKAEAMDWTLMNRGRDEITFRIALASEVVIAPQQTGEPMKLSRGKASLTITGIDSVSDSEDGKVLQVVVKGGTTKRLTLSVGGR